MDMVKDINTDTDKVINKIKRTYTLEELDNEFNDVE